MPRTKLSRRLADAYGVSLPVPPPVPVADYWAIQIGSSGPCWVRHYFGSTFLEEVSAPNIAALAEGTNVHADGHYDPATTRLWFRQNEDVGGTFRPRACRIDLTAGTFDYWRPGEHFPEADTIDYAFSKFLRIGNSIIWAVITVGHFPDGLSELDPYLLRVMQAPVTASIAGATVLAEIELDWEPGKTENEPSIGDVWPTNGNLNLMLQEHWDDNEASELFQHRYLRTAGGGAAVNEISAQPFAVMQGSGSAIEHPTDQALALMMPHSVRVAPSQLATRGQGDVAPGQLWPTEWDGVGGFGGGGHPTVKGLEVVVGHTRGPLNGPFGDEPTEMVSISDAHRIGQR